MWKGSVFSLKRFTVQSGFWFLSETLHVSTCLETILKNSFQTLYKTDQVKTELSRCDGFCYIIKQRPQINSQLKVDDSPLYMEAHLSPKKTNRLNVCYGKKKY